MKMKPGTYCPLIHKDCIQMRCAWWMKLSGIDKNTGQPIDDWGCAVTWLPTLLVENANEMRQAGAAIESMRNENVKGEDATRKVLMTGLGLFDDRPKLRAIEGGDDGTP
jgi:hypothetical protein